MAAFSAEDRLTTLDRLVDQLREDERIDALVLVGSLAGNTADRWSDIDLEVLVAGTADSESVAAEWVQRAYADSPVVSHFEVAFGSSLVRGFLLRNLLEIDPRLCP
ncbi:MAG: nucleotidyltransferase domain-containing protein [Candidatus Limnocylindria bacterium]